MIFLTAKRDKQSGFTLVEMMVATALFIVVALVITGALMMVLQSYRKVQSAKLAMDNLGFAMDNMILQLRDGSDYQCAGDDYTAYCTGIKYANSDGETKQFIYDGDAKSLVKQDGDGSNPVTLTAPEARVTDLRFYIRQNSCADLASKRPLVVVFARGVAGKREGTQTAFALQTTVSQRNARPTSVSCPSTP